MCTNGKLWGYRTYLNQYAYIKACYLHVLVETKKQHDLLLFFFFLKVLKPSLSSNLVLSRKERRKERDEAFFSLRRHSGWYSGDISEVKLKGMWKKAQTLKSHLLQTIFKMHCSEFTHSKISTATKVRSMDHYIILRKHYTDMGETSKICPHPHVLDIH